ncbi:MAG: monovalent cation/H+ antiporter subunit D family protein [Hyphomicrobiaceae bacterium]
MSWLAPETLVALAVAIPFAGALIIPLFRNAPDLREGVTLVTATLLALVVWSLLPELLAGRQPARRVLEVVPGLVIAFRVEPLGQLFALVAASLWIVNSVYSIGYMRANGEPRQTTFYVCFAVAIGSTMGLAFSANLFTLFLFYELITLSTYPLVTHKADADAMKGGRIYLLMLIGTSMLLLLPAIVLTGALAGTLDFKAGGVFPASVGPGLLGALLALYMFGTAKAALMPLHFWLPAAMVAPTPVSALLHAVAVVKAGVFTVLKVVVMVFGVERLASSGAAWWLVWAAGITVVLASLVALRQDNLKKRLAYSTVSQLSYVVLGAAILTPLSVVGAALHIAAHAVSKITLFFAAGAIYTAAHKTEISQLDGIGRRMPWTMGCFAIGALAMIGLPPTAGFLGKWFMLSAATGSGQWLPVAVIIASTVLNAAYFLPIVFRAFFVEPAPHAHSAGAAAVHDEHDHGEAPLPMIAAMVVTATATILLFVVPDIPLALARLLIQGGAP